MHRSFTEKISLIFSSIQWHSSVFSYPFNLLCNKIMTNSFLYTYNPVMIYLLIWGTIQVLAGLLDVTDRADWRNCEVSKEEETQMAEGFKKRFEEFDPTQWLFILWWFKNYPQMHSQVVVRHMLEFSLVRVFNCNIDKKGTSTSYLFEFGFLLL